MATFDDVDEIEHPGWRTWEEEKPEVKAKPAVKKKSTPPPAPPAIVVTQENAADKADVHGVTRWVVGPPIRSTPASSFRFYQMPIAPSIRELLFKVIFRGRTFWVGAAVPEGTTDFTRAQLFFHPTVRQNGVDIATDADYPDFKGGWLDVVRYTEMMGSQLAATGRLVTLLVPFTTMAAVNAPTGQPPADNMFSDRPLELLTAVLEATRRIATPSATGKITVSALGLASFSSGTHAMQLFLRKTPAGLVREILDLDGPFLTSVRKELVTIHGATSRCITQQFRPSPPPGWTTVTRGHFQNVTEYNEDEETPKNRRLHARIGWMTYY